MTSKLMGEVVTVLLMYNADHAVLTPETFRSPRTWSRRCRIKTLFELDRAIVRLKPDPPNLALSTSDRSLMNGWCQTKTVSATYESASVENAGTRMYVTEEEVEDRPPGILSWSGAFEILRLAQSDSFPQDQQEI